MFRFSLCWTCLSAILLLISIVASDVTTTVISITSTTTVHVTATDYAGACDNFVGACVVYGTANSAPYTTTVYRGRSSSPPSTTTSTTVIVATTTASNSGACASFVGACVVYATDSAHGPASTVYYNGNGNNNNNHHGLGNAQGYIGKDPNGGDGYIGGASMVQSSRAIIAIGMIFALAIGYMVI